jgi:hypothetical protein
MQLKKSSALHILRSSRIERDWKCSSYFIHGIICSVGAPELQFPKRRSEPELPVSHTYNKQNKQEQLVLPPHRSHPKGVSGDHDWCLQIHRWLGLQNNKNTSNSLIDHKGKKQTRSYRRKQFITYQTKTYTGTSRNRTLVHPRSPEGMRHKNLQGKKWKSESREVGNPLHNYNNWYNQG